MIDFDMMLVHVGEFGMYQKILFLFQAPFAMFVTFVLFGQLFFYLYPRVYWCREHPCIDPRGSLLTPEQRRNLSVPWSFPNGDFNPCLTYRENLAETHNLVDRAQMACDGLSGWQQSPNTSCDYYNFTDRVDMTTRPRRYASPSHSYYDNSDDYYGSTTTNRYYDRTSTTGYQYMTTTTYPGHGTSAPWKPGNGRPGPTGPAPAHNNETCQERTVALRLHRNIRIVAQNFFRPPTPGKSGEPLETWPRTTTCRNWTWAEDYSRPVDPPYMTVVMENPDGRWLCAPEDRINIANAVFYVGAIIGGVGIGFIADSRGRVPALVTANVLGCIGGALSAVFYQNFYVFLLFRFISGMAFDNSFTMIYILVLEYVGPTYRTLVANLSIAVFYTIGTLLLPLLAMTILDWRIFALAISLPMSLALLAICIVPESARWLLSKGRVKEATTILRSFAKVNKKKVSEEIFQEFEKGAEELYEEFSKEVEPSLIEGFKKPRIAKNFFLLSIIWPLIALCYDGHSRNILNLGENFFILFAIASSTEFPADMLVIFTLDRVGRRWLGFAAMICSGGFSFISAFIPQNLTTVALIAALISRFFVNVAFNIGLQFAAELLPTVIRAQGVNVIHIMGYFSSIFSPFIASIGRTNPALSLTMLGILACISGTLCLFLPETLGEDLPNTLDEGQDFGKDQSFWNCPLCAKPKMEDEEPVEVAPPTAVQLRNNMRATLRGETFRSSIISTSSSSRRVTPTDHLLMNPSGTLGGHTKLRRVYTQ